PPRSTLLASSAASDVYKRQGQKEAYELVAPILKQIAAVAEDGEPCVTYIGADGAGHYVKMVHNGIEYGDMQLIAEAYALLK
ncbi:hypothetical protein ELP57_39745, partial [Klebsiella pneumoniae]|nr:hypothetical protein [Klebsiella pneumoniae]